MSVFAYSSNSLNNWPSLAAVGQFFYILLLVAFIALLAYYSTKLLASARGGRNRGKQNLEIIESTGVGTQSAVQIIRAGEKYFLIGVTKEQVTLLAELDEAQIQRPDGKKIFPDNAFDKILQRFMQKDKPEERNEARDENL